MGVNVQVPNGDTFRKENDLELLGGIGYLYRLSGKGMVPIVI